MNRDDGQRTISLIPVLPVREERHQQDPRHDADRAAADLGHGLDRFCRRDGEVGAALYRADEPGGAREDEQVEHHHADQCACGFLHVAPSPLPLRERTTRAKRGAERVCADGAQYTLS